MTTWTESAKATLERHMVRLGAILSASGADPVEVADDLRRHIDEEVAARKMEVVTAEDVETILQRIGLPQPPGSGPGTTGAPGCSSGGKGSGVLPSATPAKRKSHWSLLVFGVGLPAITLVIECFTHMCAAAFFDPIPTWGDVLLVASVPVINFLVWRAVRRQQAPSSAWLGAASAFSLVVSAYFSLLYAPLVARELYAR